MSDRYKGAILSPTAPTVTPQSAGGIYTSSQQLQYQGQGVWPTAFNNPINNSLRFRSSATAYLSRTPASAGNRRTWTYSIWFKQGALNTCAPFLGYWQNATIYNSELFLESTQNDATRQLKFYDYDGTSQFSFATTQSFRDVSAWYHLVVAFDSTQATSTNRVKIYLNGSQITAFSTAIYPTQNFQCNVFNNNILNWIGYNAAFGGGNAYDGYLAEVNFIDGVALTPSSFGTTDAYGIWQPIPYTGAYGTNGFYLPFTDNSALTTSSNVGLGKDFSGNGNYWVTNNISITAGSTYDSMKDVPTNTNSNTANYCVLNPLDGNNATLSGANLNFVTLSTGNANTLGSFYVSTGKWYWEIVGTSNGDIAYYGIRTGPSGYYVAYYGGNGNKDVNGSASSYGATFGNNDIIGVALDMDGGTITYYKNNVSQGAITIGNSGPFAPWIADGASGASVTGFANFGQRPFTYTPPSGFYPLNTYNLPTPTILDGDQYFNAVTYTGTSGTQAVTGVGFQPDWVWIKARNSSLVHVLQDAVRGTTAYLQSNSTAAENTNTANNWFRSFDSDGFTVATLTSPGGVSTNEWNNTGYTYVSWNWKASNAAGVSNTQGTITSTVSANTTAGFSIVTGTLGGVGVQSTVGHGLGVAPRMIIFKTRSGATYNWSIYHASVCDTTSKYFRFTTDALLTYSTVWGASLPTSTVFGVTGDGCGSPSNPFVAYCFAQVAGYSAFGSYTGNGSTDGPFIYTGFRPRYIMWKASTAAYNWNVIDTSRNPYNVTDALLRPNTSDAESIGGGGSGVLDILSNGFKLRSAYAGWNDANTYIYAAFAENPFKIARAR